MFYNKCSFEASLRSVSFVGFALFCVVAFSSHAAAQRAASESRPVARLMSAYSIPTARQVGTSQQPTVIARPTPNAASASAMRRTINTSTATASMERRVFDLLNAERRRSNLPALEWDESLAQMARVHSDDMGTRNYFNHATPEGEQTSDRAHQCGVSGWRALGENIAFNQGFDDPAAFAVERWMQSAKHRNNILNAGFSHTGLGIAQTEDGRVYFTQVFVTR